MSRSTVQRRFEVVVVAFAALMAFASPAAGGDEFPPELVRFRAFERNPVFTAAGPGHWDAKIRERGWILKENGVWKMWYTGYDGTETGTRYLAYATSHDGLTWDRDANNPIYRDGWVEDMQVLRTDTGYLMVAEGKDDQPQSLTSPDGVHWTREGQLDIRYTNGKPLTPGPYGTPTLWHEDGKWFLFYERGDLGIWLATSPDRKVWTNVQDDPVISLGPGEYDIRQIAVNQIIKHDGRYYAYYHGSGNEKPRVWTTNVAVSTDLIHWKKFNGNPLFSAAENKSSGILVRDGDAFRLYTMHDHVDVHFPVSR